LAPLIYLDANIFIKTFETADALSAALADLMFSSHARREPAFATSELTLAEVLVHPYRHENDWLLQHYDDLLQPSPWLQMGPIIRDVLDAAALLRSHTSLKLPDAIHVSSALHFGCEFFLTGDLGIQDNYSLPTGTLRRSWTPRPIKIVRPNIDAINQLRARLNS
jgi:predicted nucleic acid-binding protein